MKKILLKLYFVYFAILAKIFLLRHKPIIIGVTGSIGKTSCRMIIYDVLKNNLPGKKIYTSDKNFNGELGLSLSVLGISDYTPTLKGVFKTLTKAKLKAIFGKKIYDIVILEYGIDYIGEMDFLLKIVKPHYSVVTKIDKVHSSQFKTKEITASEKYKLSQKTILQSFLNTDDEFYQKYIDLIPSQKTFYTTDYSSNNDILDLKSTNYRLYKKENIPFVEYDLEYKNIGKIYISTNLIGKENIGYINIGYAILENISKTFFDKSYFADFKSTTHIDFELQHSRFGIFKGIQDSILVDGSYNAAPFSMKCFIENVLLLKQTLYNDYKTIFCLGDMRELGDYTVGEHESLADFIKDKTDFIFFVGEINKTTTIPYLIKQGFEETHIRHFENSYILGKNLGDFLKQNQDKYIILFKGSQNTIFLEESVKSVLLDKQDIKHICRQEDYWIVNKNSFFEKSEKL